MLNGRTMIPSSRSLLDRDRIKQIVLGVSGSLPLGEC